jgi:tRNA (uracil-5-)-methyltransferase
MLLTTILRCRSTHRITYRMASSAAQAAPVESNGFKKRPHGQNHKFKNKKHKKVETAVQQGSNDEVLLYDVQALLKRFSIRKGSSPAPLEENGTERTASSSSLPDPQSEISLKVSEISSTGDGLAFDDQTQHTYVVPFTVPGDRVTAKVVRHMTQDGYSLTDLIKVDEPSEKRNDSLIGCKYFAKCSGCQFQMMSYNDQLEHKKTIVEKAYKNFSSLEPRLVPAVGDTIGSPLQYSYRTKLTPHFDGPPGGRRDRRHGIKPTWTEVPPIGFMLKGTRHTIDIEDCPIGTDTVRLGMKSERARVTRDIDTYKRGATLLLREDTRRIPKTTPEGKPSTAIEAVKEDPEVIVEDFDKYIHAKSCITSQTATSTEYVDDFIFENPAGAFFQNNNSILPTFTQYIRDHILPKDPDLAKPQLSYLIDAYSGSGLFTITLSQMFKKSIGIDISSSSIQFATSNARLNNLPADQASFMAADAGALFANVTFPAAETVVVIDPPRKGCDENFLSQLVRFGPERVVYVSCNVHTQARDVGMLVGGMESVNQGKGIYEIESLRGFDFFPQTGHVEGVAVLRKKAVADVSEVAGEGVEKEAGT